MNRTRDYRRFQMEKKKDNIRNWHNDWKHNGDEEIIARMSRTPQPCSCIMCGNPRRYYGYITRKELEFEKELEEWGKVSESDYNQMLDEIYDYDDEYDVRYDISDEIWDEFVYRQADR